MTVDRRGGIFLSDDFLKPDVPPDADPEIDSPSSLPDVESGTGEVEQDREEGRGIQGEEHFGLTPPG